MATETLRIDITADNKAAITGITQVKNTVDGLTESIKVYQDKAFAEKDIVKLKAYNREIQALQAQLKQTTNIGKVGFDEMGVAIKKTKDASLRPTIGIIEQITNRVELLKNGLKSATEPADIKRINLLLAEQKTILSGLTSGGGGSVNGLSKAFGVLRQAAYILPGIGIAGIFNLAFEAIGKAADGLGLFAKKEDEAAKAAAEFNKELIKQREGATEEITHMKALADVASNTSVSTKKRLQAVKELRDQYPGYFKDLTNEQILTGDITKATDSLTAAIYKRAEARAREADIAKKATTVFENQQKIEELNKKIQEAGIKKVQAGPLQLQGGFGQGIPESVKARVEENDLLKERDRLLTENATLQYQIASGQLKVNSLTADTIQLDEKETKAKKEKIKTVKEYQKLVGSIRDPILQERTKKEEKELLPKEVTSIRDKEPLIKRGSILGTNENDEKAKKMEDFAKGALKAANTLGDAFTQALVKGENLGEALTAVFKDIAAQIAAAAVKALIFQAILGIATGGTSTASAAGGAASAGGGFMDLFKGLLGFATGGTVSGPTSGYPVMLHGTEHIVRPDQMNKIVGGAAQMGAMNGGAGSPSGGEFRLSGTDLILAIQRSGFALNVRR